MAKVAEQKVNLEFETFPEQRQVLLCPSRFKVLWCGRRGGKSTTCRMSLEMKGMGDSGLYWWVAPIYRQCLRAHALMTAFFSRRLPNIFLKSHKDHVDIHLKGDRLIEFRSADNPDHLRGDGVKHVVVDEPAQMANYAWEACLYPTLLDEGGTADLIGTPPADPDHWFWKLNEEAVTCGGDCANCKRGFLDIARFSWPTHSNPYVDPGFLAHAKRVMPKSVYEREILATPTLGTSEFFEAPPLLTMLKAATEPREVRRIEGIGFSYDIWEPPRQGQFVIGADVAEGRAQGDYSVAEVLWRKEKGGKCEQVAEFKGYVDPDIFGQILLKMAAHYNRAKIHVERNGPGIATLLSIQRQGYAGLVHSLDVSTNLPSQKRFGWRTTEANKPVLLGDLRAHITEGNLMLHSKAAIQECLALRVNAKGKVTPPSKGHDDHIIALALAVQSHLRQPFLKTKVDNSEEYFLRVIEEGWDAMIERKTGIPRKKPTSLYEPSMATGGTLYAP